MEQIKDIRTWLLHHIKVAGDEKVKRRVNQGYKVLFDGPSAADKTSIIEQLGKESNKEVYHVDLRHVVSKYIGETEKNLAAVFKKAENKDWILFLDEADALFGRRTKVKDSHDKYANQEVNYLLQKMEEYPGLVILSTNGKGIIDETFISRFKTVLRFPKAGLNWSGIALVTL